jgi:hypothetical protein
MSVVAGVVRAGAQDIVGGTGREELTRPTTRASKPKPIYGTRTRTVITKNAHPTITTGTLFVAALPNATIRLEPVKGGEALEGIVPPVEKAFIFSALRPGAYRVAAALDGHKPAEQRIQIIAKKNKAVTLDLQPILYSVRITTNVVSGEVRYAPVAAYVESGEKKYRPTGVTRVVPIDARTALLSGLTKGNYGVDIRASEPSYEDRLVSITVPDDSNKEEISLEVSLKNARSTEGFSLTSNPWNLPNGWRIASSVLSTNGKGIAVPRDELYRHYTDFQLISDAKMLNGVGVSFVLRASANLENYYLIQLTGANAEEPFWLKGYVVTNDARELLQSLPINHLSSTLKSNQSFRVSIKMKANQMDVGIIDGETGKYFPLGGLVDPNRRFPIGAVGIHGDAREQNQFGSFIVCTPECPKQ